MSWSESDSQTVFKLTEHFVYDVFTSREAVTGWSHIGTLVRIWERAQNVLLFGKTPQQSIYPVHRKKAFLSPPVLAVSPPRVLATSLERRKGSSELLARALNSVWQPDACFGNLGTQRWEHRASSPFPWSGTFPLQLAEQRSHRNATSRRKEQLVLRCPHSCSFAPCCFCSQEGGAVTVILWAGCCNTGIGKLAGGKGSRLRSKLDAKCVGRNLETSFFREGRQHQSLYWWCVGFRDKRGVPVAVTLTGRGCCPSQLLLLGCCSLRSCSVTQGLSRDAFCVRANNR